MTPNAINLLHNLLHELIRGRCRTKEEYERLKMLLDDFMKEVPK